MYLWIYTCSELYINANTCLLSFISNQTRQSLINSNSQILSTYIHNYLQIQKQYHVHSEVLCNIPLIPQIFLFVQMSILLVSGEELKAKAPLETDLSYFYKLKLPKWKKIGDVRG